MSSEADLKRLMRGREREYRSMFQTLPESLRERASGHRATFEAKDLHWLGLLFAAAEAALDATRIRTQVKPSGLARPRFISWSGHEIPLVRMAMDNGWNGSHEKTLVMAAIAALSDDEGIQPFVSSLLPVVDPVTAAYLPIGHIAATVRDNETRYEECASRWLVASHIHDMLVESDRESPEDSPGLLTCTRSTATPEGVSVTVNVLNQLWPWFEVIERADEHDFAAASPREYVITDWKGLGAGELRPNRSSARKSRRRASRRRTSRTKRRTSRGRN